eukprot:695469-Ditylum_brightwellii.AAC.1
MPEVQKLQAKYIGVFCLMYTTWQEWVLKTKAVLFFTVINDSDGCNGDNRDERDGKPKKDNCRMSSLLAADDKPKDSFHANLSRYVYYV